MRLLMVITVSLLVASMGASAQSVCERLSAAIEDGTKEISFLQMDGVMDNSAPRKTNRLLGQSLQTSLMQVNLTMMAANKCPMPSAAIAVNDYRDSASSCSVALYKAVGTDRPSECDRSKWVRAK